MGILAVAQRLEPAQTYSEFSRKQLIFGSEANILSNCGVVEGGMLEGDGGQTAACLDADRAVLFQLGEHARIVGGPDDHHDIAEVLRGRRAAR